MRAYRGETHLCREILVLTFHGVEFAPFPPCLSLSGGGGTGVHVANFAKILLCPQLNPLQQGYYISKCSLYFEQIDFLPVLAK